MNRPIFSIIIPTFNSEATLQRALDSVLNQAFHDFEVLIMDGVSTDNTLAIVKKYQECSRAIKIYSEKDHGIYDAMNKGICNATGNWLYFLGSDDYFFNSEVLKKVSQFIDKSDLDVVYGHVHSTALNPLYNGEFSYEKLVQRNICHQAIFVNKTVFEKIGDFDLNCKVLADWHHNIRWFYNNDIRNSYMNLTVAEYTDGGFSSLNKDHYFLEIKDKMFFTYGLYKIPVEHLAPIVSNIVKLTKKQKKYLQMFYFRIIWLFLKLKTYGKKLF